jgi:hypothetical protein
MAIRPVEALPKEIDGVPVIQEVGEPPKAWGG